MATTIHGIPSNVTDLTRKTFCWIDLATTDLAAAEAFYAGLLGWSFDELTDQGNQYAMATVAGKRVAGIAPLTDSMKTAGVGANWLPFLLVDDCTSYAEQATELGATVLGAPRELGDGAGTYAVLRDPAGAVFGLWQAGSHEGAQLMNAAGAFSWTDVRVRDLDAARTFYTKLLGWTCREAESEGERYFMFDLDGTPRCGMFEMTSDEPASTPAYWSTTIAVSDLDAALAFADGNGATRTFGPLETTYGRILGLRDPQGAYLRLVEMPKG